ncbi:MULTISPECIES: PTS N-acetylglucosamine transporter subunit IIBC [unclassified Enterococcus]|uniref:PTS sugar transporter subunit IIA n=1 Tax=unclassified Enterococcus TaxID=2608891 RepID=UPI001552342B|nr:MULTISPECIES: PTS N-acetylglucosamine transporter subunit IIBC [unclassified Enterococcus]MBS7576737.1 PTS N-acetylglucosamine transporter subunit IIBC [Enterococcus sp. MMGLQ5-2]MBS7583776.1 PTS N-acetylglucosamine transporter subunit IIBC [Enterococcus sp. MMGLQ5-1]NPD11637.1 PTS N-acetylglucosamine transporter subunit IIBC [Enterococcus sp. MMGLQ5-1]NPD36574.1 PTS N-acetylglucosamine transporter subunit IIBC [Enterococcus sp. MMGLQ5-2]
MKRKIIIASHHRFADGLKDTLEYIAPNTAEVVAISAYLTNVPIQDEINQVLADIDDNCEVIVFTDLLGGSVNQNFYQFIELPHFHLITGMNLPVVMSIILALTDDYLSAETIRLAVDEAQAQLIYVNDFVKAQTMDDEDE